MMTELVAGWRVWPSYGERGQAIRWNAQRRRQGRLEWRAYEYAWAGSRSELLAILSAGGSA